MILHDPSSNPSFNFDFRNGFFIQHIIDTICQNLQKVTSKKLKITAIVPVIIVTRKSGSPKSKVMAVDT